MLGAGLDHGLDRGHIELADPGQDPRPAVEERPVDCLLTDYAFEESTGIALLRSIREETATLPVVLFTDAPRRPLVRRPGHPPRQHLRPARLF